MINIRLFFMNKKKILCSFPTIGTKCLPFFCFHTRYERLLAGISLEMKLLSVSFTGRRLYCQKCLEKKGDN